MKMQVKIQKVQLRLRRIQHHNQHPLRGEIACETLWHRGLQMLTFSDLNMWRQKHNCTLKLKFTVNDLETALRNLYITIVVQTLHKSKTQRRTVGLPKGIHPQQTSVWPSRYEILQ